MKLLHTDDQDLQQLQGNVYEVIRPWEGVPLLSGLLLTDIVLSAAETKVAHGLGRPIQGWLIVRTNGNAVVYESSQPSANLRDRFVHLKATGNVVVTLWVF